MKEGLPLDKLVLEGQSFVGPFDSSNLEPFFDTLRDTGFPILTDITISNCSLRNIDVMVLVWLCLDRQEAVNLRFVYAGCN